MKILISGINGRMGREVYALKGDNEIIGCDQGDKCDLSINYYSGFDSITEKADVIIDFSSAKATEALLNYAVKTKTPLVIGTTGQTKEQLDEIDEAAKKIAVFKTANMSFGVNATLALCKRAAELLGDYDIEIIEAHHRNKLDAPSGTAILLAEAINEALGEKREIIVGRSGMSKRGNEICISSVRGGSIVGEHEVLFIGANDIITIKHAAASRGIFASGAMKAAQFLADKKVGKYDMSKLI